VGAGQEDGERGGVGLGRPDLVVPQLLHELGSRDHLLSRPRAAAPPDSPHQTADLSPVPPRRELSSNCRRQGGGTAGASSQEGKKRDWLEEEEELGSSLLLLRAHHRRIGDQRSLPRL